MMNRTLDNRLRKVEARRQPSLPMRGTVIIAGSAEAAERIRAESEAAGTHRPGWPLILITSAGWQDAPPGSRGAPTCTP